MPFPLVFDLRHEYDTLADGITIETILIFGDRSVSTQAKVDTGAQVCLFQRELGEQLGIAIENGLRVSLGSLAGSLPAYGHSVTLYTLGLEFESVVYFAAGYRLERNLLGREGWLQKIRLAIVDYDSTVYFSHYDQQI